MSVLQGSQPNDETPLGMGATLEIQRQQRLDLLDQQMLLAQYNEGRRNARHQNQVNGLKMKTYNYLITDKQSQQLQTITVLIMVSLSVLLSLVYCSGPDYSLL